MWLLLSLVFGCGHGVSEQPAAASNEPPELATLVEELHQVETQGLSMELRSKRLSTTLPTTDRIVLLLPSATYATAPNWDLEYADSSVMDWLAQEGWYVFALDLPGYGKSDDPPHPATFGAAASEPFVDAAVSDILSRCSAESVDLLGWSWGSQVAGYYANRHPQRVRSLILCGFTYARRLPPEALPQTPHRAIDRQGALSDFVAGCSAPGVAEAYADAVVAADLDAAAPSGPIRDYVQKLPLVDPARLPMPVLLVCGEYEISSPPEPDGAYADFFAARKADILEFSRLRGIELQVIPGGGHVVHLEKPRDEWRRLLLTFLDSSH